MGNGANCDYCENKCKCSLCKGDMKILIRKDFNIKRDGPYLTLNDIIRDAFSKREGNPDSIVPYPDREMIERKLYYVVTIRKKENGFYLDNDSNGISIIKQHKYSTLDRAAMDAANHIYKKSFLDYNDLREYGITIYNNGNNFYLTEMKLGPNGEIDPDNNIGGYIYVAHVHSHPREDKTGQTFSLSDYINYYKTRVGKDGITGYLVSHIDNIEFIKSKNCVLNIGEHCENCLVDDPRRGPRENCEACQEQCEKCTKIEGGYEGGGLKINFLRGALMKFTPPPAEKIFPVGHKVRTNDSYTEQFNPPQYKQVAPNGCRAVNDGSDSSEGIADGKLKKWIKINRTKTDEAYLNSGQLRRRFFRTHVEITAITQGSPIEWFSGKHIIFPGR